MVLSSLLALVTVQASPVDLAYIARFYKPGSEVSKFRLYFQTVGKSRVELKTRREPDAVQWLDRNRLAWIERDANQSRVYISTLKPWAPKLVASAPDLRFESSIENAASAGPRRVLIVDGSKEKALVFSSKGDLKEQMGSSVRPAYVVNLKDDGAVFRSPFDTGEDLILKEFAPVSWGSFEGRGLLEVAWSEQNGRKIWLFTNERTSTWGDSVSLYAFNWDSAPKVIFTCMNSFDFKRGRKSFAACTHRELAKLPNSGGKEVWTSKLLVGDTESRTARTVLGGIVWSTSPSIRP